MLGNKRAYLTGDKGYVKNNLLYFCGRKDRQIKFNGYRIELEDITNNLLKLRCVNNAVTICKNKSGKIINIISFVQLKEGYDCSEHIIRQELIKRIPKYMVPKIRIVSKFDLNQNGKIDLKKLEEIINV